jgi:hypothetical protein
MASWQALDAGAADAAARDLAEIAIRLLDDAYMSWRRAQIECHQALRAWLDSGGRSRVATDLAYRAALDREEAAARDLERLSQLTAA